MVGWKEISDAVQVIIKEDSEPEAIRALLDSIMMKRYKAEFAAALTGTGRPEQQ